MVAMTVWPTDAADGSVATEARWRKMARCWAPSGVVDNAGGELVPTLAYPNLTVQSGAAWVDGHYTELAGAQVLAVTANGIVVIRVDPAANTAELLYRDGITVPAQDPAGTYELLIAQISGSALIDRRSRLVNPNAGALMYRQMDYTPITSGDISTTPVIVTSMASTMWFHAGRDYDIRAYLTLIAQTGTGNTAGLVKLLIRGGATLNSADIYIPSPNVNIHGDIGIMWRPATTQLVQIDVTLEKEWWGANPVRFAVGAVNPKGLTIADLGIGP